MENKHTIADLYQMQSLPLDAKVRMTMARIEGWIREFGEDGVYISFSGGKDSTVLMDIIRNQMGYDIPAVFVDVPTQYPELRDYAKSWKDVEVIKPKMSFMEVCEKYGFPLISKEVSRHVSDVRNKGTNCYAYRLFQEDSGSTLYDIKKWKFLIDAPFNIGNRCCTQLKKNPLHNYGRKTKRKPITAQMADESKQRTAQWIKFGCNGFSMKSPISNPMSFWTEQDVLQYIHTRKLPICSVYGEVVEDYEAEGLMEGQVTFGDFAGDKILKTTGCKRTGCMLCGFGCHLNNDTRFLQLKQTHEKMYNLLDIVKNNGVTFREAIEWTNEHGNLNIKL